VFLAEIDEAVLKSLSFALGLTDDGSTATSQEDARPTLQYERD
jgi:hypothetical protein